MTGVLRTGLRPGQWVKAGRSTNANNCVEVLFDGERYHLRDTKDAGTGPVFVLDPHGWAALVRVVLRGPVRTAVQLDDLRLRWHTGAGLALRRGASTLRFTPDEVACFVDGLLREEFTPVLSA